MPDTKSAYVIQMIKDAADEALARLHEYLVEEAGGTRRAGHRPWIGNRLRLFCSHLAAHKQIVGQVGEQLAMFGVEPFVAHDSIEPSNEWIQVIENASVDCDAMIVFLHEGFQQSVWCDQETDWALGRQRPSRRWRGPLVGRSGPCPLPTEAREAIGLRLCGITEITESLWDSRFAASR